MDDGYVGYITKFTLKKKHWFGKREKKNPLVAHINK